MLLSHRARLRPRKCNTPEEERADKRSLHKGCEVDHKHSSSKKTFPPARCITPNSVCAVVHGSMTNRGHLVCKRETKHGNTSAFYNHTHGSLCVSTTLWIGLLLRTESGATPGSWVSAIGKTMFASVSQLSGRDSEESA